MSLEERFKQSTLSKIPPHIKKWKEFNELKEEANQSIEKICAENYLFCIDHFFERRINEKTQGVKKYAINFYRNEDAKDNLEIEKLENAIIKVASIKHKKIYEAWGNNGRRVLKFFLENVPTNKSFIQYFQKGVRELVENNYLRTNINELFLKTDGLFLSKESLDTDNLQEKFQGLKNYSHLETLCTWLSTASSEVLQDIRTSIFKNTNEEHIRNVIDIANKKEHQVKIKRTTFKDNYGDTVEGFSSVYILDGKEILVENQKDYYAWNLSENSRKYDSVLRPIDKVITNSLKKDDFKAIKNIQFAGAILGYLNGLANLAINLRDKYNIPISFPTFGKRTRLNECYNINLLLKTSNITPNNILFSKDEQIFIIAGPNSAGKTVYLQQTGMMHILAQIGSILPAKESRIKIVKGIRTHFSKSQQNIEGSKLDDEVKRLDEIITYANPQELLLLDEPILGTSSDDAITLSKETIKALGIINAPTIYTTHLHEVQKDVEAKPEYYKHCVNMRVKVEGSEQEPIFTYSIEPGIAGKSYGVQRAKRFYEPLKILKKRKLL